MASVDDVHNLLNAVNTVTLKRMENKMDAINAETLKRIEEKNDRAIGELRAALNVELGEIQHRLGQVMRKLDIPFEPAPPKS